jgi:hypothetical protein
MMRAMLSMVLGAVVLLAGCQGEPCSNVVSSTEFGFSLTIPATFTCAGFAPTAQVLEQWRWYDIQDSWIASVVVKAPSSDGGQGQTTNCQAACPGTDALGCFILQDLGQTSNGSGMTFTLKKLTLVNETNCQPTVFNYIAESDLPSGNGLFITVSAQTDNGALAATLDTIIQTVQRL